MRLRLFFEKFQFENEIKALKKFDSSQNFNAFKLVPKIMYEK